MYLEAARFMPHAVYRLGFGWLLAFAVSAVVVRRDDRRVRTAIRLLPRVIVSGLLAMLSTAFVFFGAVMFGTFATLPLAIISLIPGVRTLIGVVLFPLSQLPLAYLLIRLWPLPFVVWSEFRVAPVARSWDLTKNRTLNVVVPLLAIGTVLWPARIAARIALEQMPLTIPSQLLGAAFEVLLGWTLPVVLALLTYSWLRADPSPAPVERL